MEKITDKHLLKLFDDLIIQHKKWITEHGGLNAMAIMVTKKNEPILILLKFSGYEEKIASRNAMKKLIVEQDIKGYFFCCDSKMTYMDIKDPSKTVVKDAVIHQLFTPKASKSCFIIHDEKKILEIVNGDEFSNEGSEWDLWGGMKEDSKITQAYQKFKNENPKEYEDV